MRCSLSPRNQLGPGRLRNIGPTRRDGFVIFREDADNYCYFTLTGPVGGPGGQGYSMTCYNAGGGRFQMKVWDAGKNLLTTAMATGGFANVPAKIASNATLKLILKVGIIGSISNEADKFSTGTASTDASRFMGAT